MGSAPVRAADSSVTISYVNQRLGPGTCICSKYEQKRCGVAFSARIGTQGEQLAPAAALALTPTHRPVDTIYTALAEPRGTWRRLLFARRTIHANYSGIMESWQARQRRRAGTGQAAARLSTASIYLSGDGE